MLRLWRRTGTAFLPAMLDLLSCPVGAWSGTGTRVSNTRSVVVPNHRDDEPIRLFDDEDSYRLEDPPAGHEDGEPDTVSPIGPIFWDDGAPPLGLFEDRAASSFAGATGAGSGARGPSGVGRTYTFTTTP